MLHETWNGWLLARRNWPGKSVVETIVALPLVMPPVATGLILLKLFGRRGPMSLHILALSGSLRSASTNGAILRAM